MVADDGIEACPETDREIFRAERKIGMVRGGYDIAGAIEQPGSAAEHRLRGVDLRVTSGSPCLPTDISERRAGVSPVEMQSRRDYNIWPDWGRVRCNRGYEIRCVQASASHNMEFVDIAVVKLAACNSTNVQGTGAGCQREPGHISSASERTL